jgi:hypothetical protein
MPTVEEVSRDCDERGTTNTCILTDLAVLVPQDLKAVRMRRPKLVEPKKR